MSDSRDMRTELILGQLQQLPSLPPPLAGLLASGDPAQAVQWLLEEPELSARLAALLQVEPPSDPRQLLQEGGLWGLLILCIPPLLKTQATEGAFSVDEFWRHALAVGCCAELLAEAMDGGAGPAPLEALAAGLLHDLGKAALHAALPKSYDKVVQAADLLHGNIADLEGAIIGLDHLLAGKRLCEQWGLPQSVRECVWLHGQEVSALPAGVRDPRLISLVTLADQIVRRQHLGYSGNYSTGPDPAPLMASLGLDAAAIDRAVEQLVPRMELRAAAMEPGQISQQDLYQDALAQANDELERMEDQLAARNRRLKARSRFFDALAAFQGELRPDAAPALALQAIAQTAVAALGTAPVAAFSAPAGQSVAQVILVSENGEVLLNCVRECPPRIARPPEGVGPVLGAGEEVEWLLEEVSPRLGGNQRFWICLEAERACIGGIVWGGRAGEAQRLSAQAAELAALACGWSLALRTAQIREESRVLAEQLAESNRQLHSAQAELLRGRTLVSVGEMAAGAAHEMNNPLAVISGRAQVLAGQLADPKLRHAAATIIEHAHRLSQIISDLMEFAKPQPPRLAAVDVADLVGRSVHEAKSQSDSADRNIEVTIAAVPPVLVDVKQLTAALVEVIDNAISATDAQQGRVLIHAAYDSHTMKVALSISDNGCGMDEETRKRAFDPFFSSKPAGRRRGLGLAKALRWIESSGGSIRLESRQGAGTRVLILMPAAYPMVSAGEAEPLASGQ